MFVVMVELILLLLCCGSSPTLFYILHRQKRQKRKALFVLSFCFFSSSYYGKFFLSRQLANKQRLGSELLVVVRLLIAIFSYSSLVIKQIIVHTRRRSGNSCRRAIRRRFLQSFFPLSLSLYYSVYISKRVTTDGQTIEFLLH